MEEQVLNKIVGMFRPCVSEQFLDYDGREVICGPNDRAMIGFDTYFPKEWLVEDYGFTPDEADWLISRVNKAGTK